MPAQQQHKRGTVYRKGKELHVYQYFISDGFR